MCVCERERESVCVCVREREGMCVCERERESVCVCVRDKGGGEAWLETQRLLAHLFFYSPEVS